MSKNSINGKSKTKVGDKGGIGKFISIEGGEGAGKSTLLDGLFKHYSEIGGFYFLREPGSTQVGESVRNLLLNPENEIIPETEALLYAAARAQLVSKFISPLLLQGSNVISDRYIDSSFAYQGFGRGLGLDYIKKINKSALRCMPNLTIFLDINVDKAKSRRGGRAEQSTDRMEMAGDTFHNDVYAGFKKLAEVYPKRIKVIDASQSAEQVLAQAIKLIDSIVKKK
ncbi:MAG: dTMP kinase [Firmicutes bacterium]|nr:dTMP kinase [Bacillota bacterium]